MGDYESKGFAEADDIKAAYKALTEVTDGQVLFPSSDGGLYFTWGVYDDDEYIALFNSSGCVGVCEMTGDGMRPITGDEYDELPAEATEYPW